MDAEALPESELIVKGQLSNWISYLTMPPLLPGLERRRVRVAVWLMPQYPKSIPAVGIVSATVVGAAAA